MRVFTAYDFPRSEVEGLNQALAELLNAAHAVGRIRKRPLIYIVPMDPVDAVRDAALVLRENCSFFAKDLP